MYTYRFGLDVLTTPARRGVTADVLRIALSSLRINIFAGILPRARTLLPVVGPAQRFASSASGHYLIRAPDGETFLPRAHFNNMDITS